ncbi:MAG: Asp/Glu racemase [Alphaproteobacteria bacterium]
MRDRLAFLHTARSNADLFEALIGDRPLRRRHVVRDDLRDRALTGAGLTAPVRAETKAALRALADISDAVVLTCSTLGPAADDLANLPVLRIDRALANAAVADGGRVGVLYAAPTTRDATARLFAEAAAATGATVTLEPVPRAWDLFMRGDTHAYARSIADAADDAAARFDVVALAQCSMAPAAALCGGRPPLTSLHLGLEAALALAGRAG